jgi:hypothetical protein
VQVELGNDNPTHLGAMGPAITYCSVPDTYTYEVADSADDLAVEVMRQMATGGGITHLPAQEAVLSVVAAWNNESSGKPSWVWSDNPDFAVLLGKFFGCPVGRPEDVEMTHWTNAGAPGFGPPAAAASPEETP